MRLRSEVARRRGGDSCKDADAVAEAVARRRTARRMKALDVRGQSGEEPGDGDGGGEAMARWAVMAADCGCGCMAAA